MANAPGFDAERMSGTLAAAVAPAVGARHTPRSTSPALAVRRIVNCSPVGNVVAAMVSVIETSWFGSAPGSPFALTVEVTAQMVTVPSPLTLPAILRRPSVDGFREVG